MRAHKLHIDTMRSQLGRARGLGSAKAGTVEHWKIERLTAIGLIPLSIWFVISMLRLIGAPQLAHRPLSQSQVTSGIFRYQGIEYRQCGQCERGRTRLSSRGRR